MRLLIRARLFWELAFAHLLVRAATFGRTKELTAESQLYFADLHFKLAAEYELAHRWVRARRHRILANHYAVKGPPPEPRPAAAMAMPVPVPPMFTDARGSFAPPPPDDIA